jgi:NADH:ubiquinone oxidoreductase subunit K
MYSTKKNLLSFLIAAEIMFLGLDLGFIGASLINNHSLGIIYSFIVLILAVGESAVGLSLAIIGLKLDDNIAFLQFNKLKY